MNKNHGVDPNLIEIRHRGEVIEVRFGTDKVCGIKLSSNEEVFRIDYVKYSTTLIISHIKVHNEENNGLGSIALKCFENWSRVNGFKKIEGDLVYGHDSSCRLKLINFYKKKNHYNIQYVELGAKYARISKIIEY